MDVDVDMNVKLLETNTTLRQIMNFKEGDVLRIDMPRDLLVLIEDLPSYRAKLGRTKEKLAIKISEILKRPESMKSDISFIKGDVNSIDDDYDIEEFDDD